MRRPSSTRTPHYGDRPDVRVPPAKAAAAVPQAPTAPPAAPTSRASSPTSQAATPQVVNSSSGAGGLYQFLPSTWATTPWGSQYPGGAQTAPVSVQNQAFQWLYARQGTSPWSTDGCG